MFDIRKIQEAVLFGAVLAESDTDTANQVVHGAKYQDCSDDNAAWVKGSMRRLEEIFSPGDVKRIRMHCQCGYGLDEKLALVKELMAGAASIEKFAGSEKAKAAGLSCADGNLYLQFPFCPCPMLAEVERLETKTWCECSAGYSKVLFEKSFQCDVDVEMLKSIKAGDDICLMKIILHDPVWG